MSIFNVLKGATSVVKSGAAQKGAKLIFAAKKYGPTVAVIGGVVGTVAAGVIAVKKSIDDAPEALEEIHAEISAVKHNNLGNRAMARVYCRAGLKLAKVYALPIVIEGVSICSILYGYNVINGRFAAMGATAAALEEANRRLVCEHDSYRAALVEKYGEDFDSDIKWEGADFDISGNPPIDENGEEGCWKLKGALKGYNKTISPYAVIFDETSTEWSKDPEYNRMTLHRIQMTCNDMLQARGHLFLNDVYHELGMPSTRAGQIVGWIVGNGDGYVDFGIYDLEAVNNRAEFINGYEPSILLDFNVDGVIWDKI